MNASRRASVALLLATLVATAARAQSSADPTPLVFAAASLTNVLQQIGADYERDQRRRVRLSFASSATLARQLEAGARADLFISADEDWMDYVARRDLLQPASRVALLGNSLVLVAPADSSVRLTLAPGVQLAAALGARGRLALADPASVPAGKYARAALTTLGAWPQVAGRHVAAENVRMALLLVARGEAPLGVVYRTDALAEPKVRIVAVFPATSHPVIAYPAALTRGARPGTDAFLGYLMGPAAGARFRAAGFSLPTRP